MARRAQAPRPRATAANDTVVYFFLTTYAPSWRNLSDDDMTKYRDNVTAQVTAEGGTCKLYLTQGTGYDSVSVVQGVSPAGALRIADEIQKDGVRTTKLVSGSPIKNG